MKKLNKKGVTLIELIVSFAIVSIAMIYFYQTIVDLHRMYKNSNKATDEFVNKDYALRVLDAWATKLGNDLSSLPSDFCTTYSLFCNNVTTSTESYYKTATLTDGKISVIYYKANKTLYQINIESMGIFDSDGNIKNYTALTNAMNFLNASDKLSVTFDNENKITYKITNSSGTELYSKTNSKSINKVINDLSNQTEETIKEKVQELVGTEYKVKESVEEIETGVYARVYNIVKEDTNATVAKNIYEIENTQMEKLDEFNLNVSGDQSNRKYEDIIGKEMNINGETQHIENKGSYYLTFELSSNFDYDYCALFFSPKNETEYEFRWNKNEISNEYIDNVKDMGIIYKKQNDGTYVVSFLKLDVTDLNSYIKPYKWDESCKIKLVEAYKYK